MTNALGYLLTYSAFVIQVLDMLMYTIFYNDSMASTTLPIFSEFIGCDPSPPLPRLNGRHTLLSPRVRTTLTED